MMKQELVRADLHTHNWYSPDSPANPVDVVKMCVATGIRILAVTNHNIVAGVKETQEIAQETGADLVVIPGEEITLGARNSAGKRVELLAYFLQETIPANLLIEDALKEIQRQGGIAGIPHPFELWRHGAGKEIALTIATYAHELGVPMVWEVFNTRATAQNNVQSEECYSYNRATYGFHVSAGSDAHHPREIGRGGVLLATWSGRTPEELKQGFLASTGNPSGVFGDDNFIKTVGYRTLTRASNLVQSHPHKS